MDHDSWLFSSCLILYLNESDKVVWTLTDQSIFCFGSVSEEWLFKSITFESWFKTVGTKKNSIKSNEFDLNLFVCMKVIRSDLKTDKKLKIPTELRTTTSHFDYSMTSNVFWILSRKPFNLHSKLHGFSNRCFTFDLPIPNQNSDLTKIRIWPWWRMTWWKRGFWSSIFQN